MLVGHLSGPPLAEHARFFKDRMVCDCGEWLPLGPANDGGEHAASVAVEKRAAELSLIPHWERDPAYDSESYGLLCYENGGTPGDDDDGGSSKYADDEWAGYLARVIATHED